ncbi:CHAT domain-containing protein [Nonomuraea wenchangensis]
MPEPLRLRVEEYAGPARWRWTLTGSGGEAVATHEVELDPGCWEFAALTDLYGYVRLHAAPDRRLADEARIVHLVGRWLGEHVFGSVGAALARLAPAQVMVTVTPEARVVTCYPLEAAVVGERTLAARGVALVFGGGEPSAKPPPDDRLRILGLFSAPDGARALDLRKERRSLARLAGRAAAQGRAVELRVLQYGVTRRRLREVVQHPDGWDILHFSGHGRAGALLLEAPDGSPDPITSGELVELLAPARPRVKVVTVSACSSAAVTAAELLRLLGVAGDSPAAGLHEEGDGQDGEVLPTLAMTLADRLDCAVLGMRFPVVQEFATALAESVYTGLLAGRTLPGALAPALSSLTQGVPTPRRPALSVATPALFGARALDATVPAPEGPPVRDEASARKLDRLPPQPERFVGRVSVMARAGSILAPESRVPGIVLHGMAGAGKTACALELAYTHHDSFDGIVWFTAPDENADGSDALTRFALALQARTPDLEWAHLLEDETALARILPELSAFARRDRVLIVVDNAESLVTADGAWRDERWGRVLGALTAHEGGSRLVVTSRVALPLPGTRAEPVHALSRDESVLLIEELPRLRDLLHGRSAAGRQAVARVLEVAQGHPKLLELADGHAGDHQLLSQLLAGAGDVWESRGGLPTGFFLDGRSTAGPEDYAEVVATWTRAAADRLSEAERAFFWFLCALEEQDRAGPAVGAVIERAWPDVRRRAALPGESPATDALLGVLVERALAAITRDREGRVTECHVHPLVVAAALGQTPPPLLEAVADVLAEFWAANVDAARRGEDAEESSGAIRSAAHAAVPYLIRRREWARARVLLEEVVMRDRSPSTVTALLPAARRLAEASARSDGHLRARGVLARLIRLVDPRAGVKEIRRVLDQALREGRYDLACVAATDAAEACVVTGRLSEALAIAEAVPEYSRLAGYGPWTRLYAEEGRLEVLAAQGHHEQVLAEVDRLLAHADTLDDTSGLPETVTSWTVRESLLYAGCQSAQRLGRWEEALAHGDGIAASERTRDAPADEVMRTRFDTYYPLLRLGRVEEAVAVLRECREVFEAGGDLNMLSRVMGALADAEDQLGHGATAVSLARAALRLTYRVGDPETIATVHHGLGHYLARHAGDPVGAALQHLAAATVRALTGSGYLEQYLHDLAADLRAVPGPATLPSTPSGLAQAVQDSDGVRLDILLDALLPAQEAQQQALDDVLTRARALAAGSSTGGTATSA